MKTLVITLSIALGAFILIPNIVAWNNRPSPYSQELEDMNRLMIKIGIDPHQSR